MIEIVTEYTRNSWERVEFMREDELEAADFYIYSRISNWNPLDFEIVFVATRGIHSYTNIDFYAKKRSV